MGVVPGIGQPSRRVGIDGISSLADTLQWAGPVGVRVCIEDIYTTYYKYIYVGRMATIN